jgi:glycosyltransferase involved in cell wall biosynthesis
MNRIAVLLNDEIYNDNRVIKMIQSLSKIYLVDLYYINGRPENDKFHFSKNVRLFSFVHNDTFWVKVLRHSFFCFEFNFYVKKIIESKINYSIVWANDLPTLYPAYTISKKLNCKLVFDAHEIYVETLNQFFPKKANFLYSIVFACLLKIMKWHGNAIENKIIPEVDLFISVNDSLINYFKNYHNIKKTMVIMNFPITSEKSDTKFDFRLNYEWSISDIIFLYQGVFNQGRGLELLIDLFNKLPDNYKLILIGEGSLKNQLEKLCVKHKLTHKIKFMARQPSDKLLHFTAAADFGINLLEPINKSKALASPNKLFEYIHASLPVIASNSNENIKIFSKYNVGYLTENSIESLKNILLNINQQEVIKFKKNCEKAKTEFNWEKQEKTIFDEIKSL